jgi:hypothetical protein
MKHLYSTLICLAALAATSKDAKAQSTNIVDYYFFKDHGKNVPGIAAGNEFFMLYNKARKAPYPNDTVVTIRSEDGRKPVTIQEVKVKTGTKTVYDTVRAFLRFTPSLWQRGLKFSARQEKDSIILTPFPFKSGSNAANRRVVDGTNASSYYVMIAKGPNEAGKPVRLKRRGVGVGLLAVPARLHFGNRNEVRPFRLSVEAGAALYVSKSLGYTDFYANGTKVSRYFEPTFFLGFTNLSLTAENTNNNVAKDTSAPAISTGLGFIMGQGDLKGGLVLGHDFPITPIGRTWQYSDALFLGVVLSLELAPFK